MHPRTRHALEPCPRKRGPLRKPQSRSPQLAGQHPRAKRNEEEVIRKVREEFPPLAIDPELAKALAALRANASDRG